MTVKEHYNQHLGNFYSWLVGDFDKNMNSFISFCIENELQPYDTKCAIDLGAGNGIQSLALAQIGYYVHAVDFNNQLLAELESRINDLPVNIVNEDMRNVKMFSASRPDLIVCCGDTLTHLDSFASVENSLRIVSVFSIQRGKLF